MDCIFCKIIEGFIPSNKVYETENFLAFLDINQNTLGHTLVIPKRHLKDVFELTEDINKEIFNVVQKVATSIKNTFKAKGINIINNNGEIAGQTVFHFHIHLIPRYIENDGFGYVYKSNKDKYTKESLKEIADKIKGNI